MDVSRELSIPAVEKRCCRWSVVQPSAEMETLSKRGQILLWQMETPRQGTLLTADDDPRRTAEPIPNVSRCLDCLTKPLRLNKTSAS